MDTQVINQNAANGNSKETLKKGAALAGSAAIGAGAVVSADIVRGDEELELAEAMTPEVDSQTIADNAQTEENGTPTTDAEHATNTAATDSPTVSHPSEPQPQTSNTIEGQHTQSANATTAQHTDVIPGMAVSGEINTNDIPDVDPDLVAQDITDDVIMVDPTDNDMANLDIAAVGKIETVDGQVLTAAQFTGDNGESLYAVDVDGDNTYDIVTDDSGNVLAGVPTTLTVSDSENIASVNHGDTGYLAHSDTDNTADDTFDNPMDDVVELG